MSYDAIVLAGGTARRLGGAAKPQLEVGGRTLLDRAVGAVSGAGRIVVVGPEQPFEHPAQHRVERPAELPSERPAEQTDELPAELTDERSIVFCREDPPGGGPVAALAAGLPNTAADVVLVLAADLPWVAPAVPLLLAALPSSGAAFLLDAAGRVNYLAAAWRRASLEFALAAVGDPVGAPVRALAETVNPVYIADQDGWADDCDTWEDLASARSRREEPDA